LRIQRVSMINASSRKRILILTSYSELILGTDKEETQMHIITEWDSESQALFAYNRYHPDFGSYLAFSSSLNPIQAYTGDRTEFLGRNRTEIEPEALKRKTLSNHTGAALDPCAAIQILIELEPGEKKEAFFLLGYSSNAVSARELILKCRTESMIEQL